MDFNSILIGSENPEGLRRVLHEGARRATFSDGGYSGWQIGSGWVDGRAALRGQGHEPVAGRIIWNIETDDVKGDFERMKAAGAIVVAEPYAFDPGDDAAISTTAIATLADPDGNYFQLMSPIQM